MQLITSVTYLDYPPWSAAEDLYILERPSIAGTAAKESILASSSKQTDSYLPSMWPGTLLRASHSNGLAILRLACLDLVLDLSPKLKHLLITLIHTTSYDNMALQQLYTATHIYPILNFHGRVEEGLLGPNNSVRHTVFHRSISVIHLSSCSCHEVAY
jgi:hypothetical protein